LLNKGLIYNLSHKLNDWITTLALQGETANFSLPKAEQEHFRWEVTLNINSLYQSHAQYVNHNVLNHNVLNENKLLAQINKNSRIPKTEISRAHKLTLLICCFKIIRLIKYIILSLLIG
jgi:hypothetical protein